LGGGEIFVTSFVGDQGKKRQKEKGEVRNKNEGGDVWTSTHLTGMGGKSR